MAPSPSNSAEDVVLRLDWPALHPVPDQWRTRIEDMIGTTSIAAELGEVRRVGEQKGNLAAEALLRDVQKRYPNLLPGEAGFELAWAIAFGGSVPIFRPDRGDPTRTRAIFDEPTPPYLADARKRGRNRFRPRRARRNPEPVLERLRGNGHDRPLTHAEIAHDLGESPKSFHRYLAVLRDQRVRIPRSREQTARVELFVAVKRSRIEREPEAAIDEWMKRLRQADHSRARHGPKPVPIVRDDVERLTGFPPDLLKARGVETFVRSHLGDATRIEVFVIPAEMLSAVPT